MNQCIAMILAGGSGSRLMPLTRKLAKPAILFGGKYRIIDFVISNCINSGIDLMGIMVQYEPLVLSTYFSSGGQWYGDRKNGCITVLPPHMHEGGGCWYRGTADAVYQNTEFIDMHKPENVIILAADQVYKMDYSMMLKYHIFKNADITVASTRVPLEEANRFGILESNSDGRICTFYEKPSVPKGNLASMGIYIFKTHVLKKILEADNKNPDSSNDFGKDILPRLVAAGDLNIYTYKYEGYWRDVGTLKSFWQAHMDLLDEDNKLNLYDPEWNIYCENLPYPPLYINHTAKVNSSLIGDGCYIQGEVFNSILFPRVFVGRNSTISDSVIMSNVTIQSGCSIRNAIIGSNACIHANCRIGFLSEQANDISCIDEGKVVKEGTLL